MRPIIASSLRSAPCVWGCPRTLRAPRRRHAVAARAPLLFVRRKSIFVRNEPGLHMYIFTRLSTNERRSGAPGLRPRDSSSEFSTALAGGRGAASAPTASRWRAPRGGSSAPPVWSRPSSACPKRAPTWRRRSLRTVAVSRGVSWFGRALAACEGGIESRVRARGVGRSSRRASNVCRLGGARPRPAVIIASMGSCVSAEGRSRSRRGLRVATWNLLPRRHRLCLWTPALCV